MILKLGGSAFVYCFFELFLDFRWFLYLFSFLSLKSMSGGHMWQTKRCADWGLCGESWAQRMERMGKRSGDSKKWKKSMKFTYIYDTKQNKATWKFEMNMNDNRLGKLFYFSTETQELRTARSFAMSNGCPVFRCQKLHLRALYQGWACGAFAAVERWNESPYSMSTQCVTTHVASLKGVIGATVRQLRSFQFGKSLGPLTGSICSAACAHCSVPRVGTAATVRLVRLVRVSCVSFSQCK